MMTYEFEQSGFPEEEKAPAGEATEVQQEEQAENAGQAVKKKLSFSEQCYTILHDLVYILAFVTIFFVFAIRVVSVDGTSMLPTLVHRDYVLLLSNVFYDDEDIEYGDVVVALAPRFDNEPIVKRVIATAGQTVDIDFDLGIVYVDGVALEEDYILAPTYTHFREKGVTFPLTVQEGHVFVLGDNRNGSSDSRLATIGQVDTDYILGKVIFILVPGEDELTKTRDFDRIGAID